MGKRLTNDEFVRRINLIHQERILPRSAYVRFSEKIDAFCSVCQFEWRALPGVLLGGGGCPECGKVKARITPKHPHALERFTEWLNRKYAGGVIVLSEYKGIFNPIQVQCSKCNRAWKTTPSRLRRHGCLSCGHAAKGQKLRKQTEQFLREVQTIHADKICVLGEYRTGKNRIEVRCSQCGHTWSPVARRLISAGGRGCPRCCTSKAEKYITNLLTISGINFTQEHKFPNLPSPDRGYLRFDFAIWVGGVLSHLIEYDGRHHFRPLEHQGGEKRFETQKRNDRLKNEYCQNNGIRLIRLQTKYLKKITLEHLL